MSVRLDIDFVFQFGVFGFCRRDSGCWDIHGRVNFLWMLWGILEKFGVKQAMAQSLR